MDILTAIVVIGGVSLLIGILGGGIEIQCFKLPPIPKNIRILLGVIGVILVTIAIVLYVMGAKTPSSPAPITGSSSTAETTPSLPAPAEPSPSASPETTTTFTPTTLPSTNTPVPPPLIEIFPQAGAGEKFLYINNGGVLSQQYSTQPDCIHSGSYGLELSFDMKGTGNGGWGVQWINSPGKHFDASTFTAFNFWIKGRNGGELFQISLKDTDGNEKKLESDELLIVSTEWMPVNIPLGRFQGVNTSSIENINFGFNNNHGTGILCIDDISFGP